MMKESPAISPTCDDNLNMVKVKAVGCDGEAMEMMTKMRMEMMTKMRMKRLSQNS